MPCRCEGYEPDSTRQIDELTDMLCTLLRNIDEGRRGDYMVPTNVQVWWKKHKKSDEQRRKAEEKELKKLQREFTKALDELEKKLNPKVKKTCKTKKV